MRAEDRAECLAASGLPPELSLPWSLRDGAFAMVAPGTGEVLGLCGAKQSPLDNFGTVWMLCTDNVTKHRHELIRRARTWLDTLPYERVGNIVDARNKLHIRWLALLGFRFTGALISGPWSLPFIQFERTKNV
jgi:hypothetical protein